MQLSLRPPCPSDYITLATWIPDAASCLRWAGPKVSFPFEADRLAELLYVDQSVSYCLAHSDDVPLAFAQHWVIAPGAVHLGRILVDPHRRGQGLGRMLCTQLIAAALAHTQANSATLRVYADNLGAQQLYQSLGFVREAVQSTQELDFMRLPADVWRSAQRANHSNPQPM
ncbi:GNAT family N-acetyltransferase [Rhodoferax aquaticus]|uniref:GNAT family N-acetyltransferase n=1 Tax=Rhodoferax aquaticus TaxID=2527691 RepID=A0A515EQM3_9BURK|nr:GNAT family N-acetyltransferase [Rhodoferax aquaticus]QDL54949.1 GNAT family N-acetyltransferase [Rhodoferax aquaticus]